MREQGLSKDEVAKLSAHKTAHVLELFEQQEPNPTLKLYLGVVEAAGGRLCGVSDNSPRAFVQRLSQLCERENITVSDLARRAGLNRSSLSSLLSSETPNPKLQTIDALVTALGVEADIKRVRLFFVTKPANQGTRRRRALRRSRGAVAVSGTCPWA